MISLSTADPKAEADPWYYYGGPGYYHGYYSPGFKQYPSYYYNDRKRRSAQDTAKTYVHLLHPYRDITHYGYPHYYAYSNPIHLNYIGGPRVVGHRRHKRQEQYRSRARTNTGGYRKALTVGNYYGPFGYYGSPWWAGYGRWGYYAKPGAGDASYSYSL